MSKQASPALIGSFVLGGAALLVIFVLIIAGDSFFKRELKYVSFFEGSIYGLKVGSNVMFRGVPIGYVSKIEVLADLGDLKFTVPVTINIRANSIREIEAGQATRGPDGKDIEGLIKRGLRASLASESLITGQLYVELDFYPDTEAVYRGIDEDLPEIPSISSGIQETIAAAQSFVADIRENVDVPKIAQELSNILQGLDNFINNQNTQDLTGNLNQTLGQLDQTLASVRSTLDTVDSTFATLEGEVDPAVAALIEALQKAESVLSLAENQLQDNPNMVYRLGTTLQEVEAAARAVRNLAEDLEQQPESLLKGKK
jgi:paraquat-inducible protein B